MLFAVSKGLIEFTSKIIWAWKTLLGKIFHWKFNLVNRYRRIQVTYLFHLGWVLVVFGFHGISLFHLNCKIYVCRFVHSIPWLSFYGGSTVIIFSFIPDTGIFVFFLCQSYKKGSSFYFFSQSVFCFTVFSYCFCFKFHWFLLIFYFLPSACLLWVLV